MSDWLLHPRLSACRRIFLREVMLDANIGAHAFEKEASQRLVVNVDLFVTLAGTTPAHDQLSEVLDYDFVARTIHERIGRGHIQLQETLVDDIARTLLAHPLVVAARVASEKPDIYDDVGAVGIEVFHFKDAP